MPDEPLRQLPRTTDRRHRSGLPLAVVVLVAVVGVSIGALGAVLFLPQAVPSSLSPAPSSGSVVVSTTTYDGSHDVSAALTLAPAQMLRSPVAGVATRSSCAAGGQVASGGSLLSVGGQPILALATEAPLWRDLTSSMKGADVSALQSELARLGYAVSATGTYDGSTKTAVKAAMAKVGASSTGDLPLADVMWLPTVEVTVASCGFLTGDTVTAGQQLAQVAAGLTGMTLANPPGKDGWVVSFAGASAPVDVKGRVTDSAFLAAVAATPDFQVASAPGGQPTLTVRVQLAVPISVLTVPASAVVPTGPGAGCVVGDTGPVAVSIVASSLGKTLVQPTKGQAIASVEVQPSPSTTC